MKCRGDLALLVFGALLLLRPETFAKLLMTVVHIFVNAFNSTSSADGSQTLSEFQEDMKAFKSQMVDPRQQYHDEFWL
eukprot:CAMPEP_0202713068 /NCGR_PEP_ID=MMETSP1385-20130828/49341_1 /ASSEMBLY_ACC=CAM_ASM_000861 /TAXON_ID=933848 /ORGANISM="Elphidium margaritaceum" /LENGTH=77 /DNA_ID=CAMNT_0049373303 /DNA_START=58 /DNA_END=291 /DNA_ORIENTATION=+